MRQSPRVLYVALVELDVPGGPAVHVANLMRGFHDIGVPITLLAPRPRGAIAVDLIGTRRSVPFFGFGRLRLLLHDLFLVARVVLEITRARPSLICLRDRGRGNAPAVWLARTFGIPYLLELNGADPIDADPESGEGTTTARRIRRRRAAEIRGARTIVANSASLARQIETRYDLPPGRVRTVTMRVDGTRFRPLPRADCRAQLGVPAESLVLGYLGSFQPTHDLETILGAVRVLTERGVDVRLRCLGAGNGESEVRRRAAELAIERRVDFIGWVPHEQIPIELNALDIALSLLTAERRASAESLCKIKEFLACGIPTLVNREGLAGFAEYPPESVTPVDLDDPATDAETLAAAILATDRSPRLSTARYVTEAFSLASAARETLGIPAPETPANRTPVLTATS